MKDVIMGILKEQSIKNSLGITVNKGNQVLIIMRGIPGSVS